MTTEVLIPMFKYKRLSQLFWGPNTFPNSAQSKREHLIQDSEHNIQYTQNSSPSLDNVNSSFTVWTFQRYSDQMELIPKPHSAGRSGKSKMMNMMLWVLTTRLLYELLSRSQTAIPLFSRSRNWTEQLLILPHCSYLEKFVGADEFSLLLSIWIELRVLSVMHPPLWKFRR